MLAPVTATPSVLPSVAQQLALPAGQVLAAALNPNAPPLPGTYQQVSVYRDGSPMTDALVDGVFYAKVNGLYFALCYDTLSVAVFGIKPSNTRDQNQRAWQAMLASRPQDLVLTVPNGLHQFASTTALPAGFQTQLLGLGFSAEWNYPSGCAGFYAQGDKTKATSLLIQGMKFSAAGQDPLDGTRTYTPLYQYEDEPAALNADNYQHHALLLETVTYMNNVETLNFAGHGIKLRGNLDVSPGQVGFGVSASQISNVRLSGNNGGACGIYTTGYDAGLCVFTGVTARNFNKRGFYSHESVGCHFIGCQGDTNQEGHYLQDQAFAISTFTGCYGEGGLRRDGTQQPASSITEHSIRAGCRDGNGWTGGTPLGS